MTWDLREAVLIAKWESEGHAVRVMDAHKGVGCCLRCNTVIHVRNRALSLLDGKFWADTVKPCNGHTRDKSPT